MTKSSKLSNKQYRLLYKEIKPFVSFKIDGRTNFNRTEKAKVKKYFAELEPHLWTANSAVKLPKRNVEKILGRLDYKNTEYKAVPFRAPPDIIKAVRFSDEGNIISETKFGEYKFHSFDKVKLVKLKGKYLDEFFADFPVKTGFQIVVGDGRGVYGSFNDAETAKKEALNLMVRYSQGGEKYKRWKNKAGKWVTNSSKNWLSGVSTITYKKQKDLINFAKIDADSRAGAKKIMREFNKRKNSYAKKKKTKSKK